MAVRKNGKAYDSIDLVVNIMGTVESEVKDISYSYEVEHQLNNSVTGRDATSWSMGKKTYEASLTLYMAGQRRIEKLAPDGDVTLIAPFDINCTYMNDFNEVVNDTITCKFMNAGRQVNGEMGLAWQYKLFVLGLSLGNQ